MQNLKADSGESRSFILLSEMRNDSEKYGCELLVEEVVKEVEIVPKGREMCVRMELEKHVGWGFDL